MIPNYENDYGTHWKVDHVIIFKAWGHKYTSECTHSPGPFCREDQECEKLLKDLQSV